MKKILLSLLAATALLTGALHAQVTTSDIGGRVTDSSGAPVVGATVIAVHTPSGTQYGAAADPKGYFRISNVRPGGPYSVTVRVLGYQAVENTGINIPLGDTHILNVRLSEESVNIDDVMVTAVRNSILNSDRSGTATKIDSREMTLLPSINRSITDFTLLTPQSNGTSFAGRDGRYNNVNIDGAAFAYRFGLNTDLMPNGNTPISLDAIQEVSVDIAPFDIRQSNFTGANVNAVTKSGDNTFAGSVYTFFRPRSFNGQYVEDKTVSGARDNNRSIFGLTVGGPIIKDKLFLFVNAESESAKKTVNPWAPSSDGVANAATYVSRTSMADLRTMSTYLMDTYGYDPGVYNNFPTGEASDRKLLVRLDWNINRNHKFMLRYNLAQTSNDVLTNVDSGPGVPNLVSSARNGVDAISFSNSWYGLKKRVESLTGELNSTFGGGWSNKLLVTFTNTEDGRTTKGDLFPFVDILKDNRRYMSFGTELFSYNNNVQNKQFSVVNNVSYLLGDHTLLGGVSYERQFFANKYVRQGTTYYAYSSMDDFMNDRAPVEFSYQLGYPGNEEPQVELDFGIVSAYAQDTWRVNPKLKITGGLRLELPMYNTELEGPTRLKDGREVRSINFYGGKYDMAQWPKAKPVLSPRAGFNYDVFGDRSLQVRGGVGVFSGLLPFVWFTNQMGSSGFVQTGQTFFTDTETLSKLTFNPDFRDQVFNNPNLTAPKPGVLSGSDLAVVDRNFKMPRILRSSLAVDYRLPNDLVITAEVLQTYELVNIIQKNVNLQVMGRFEGPDNREYMTKVDPEVSSFIVLSNGKAKGRSTSMTLQLTKDFSNGISGMVAYTYNRTKDLASNPGSTANSVFTAGYNVGNPNEPALGYSNYSMPHRVNGYFSYRAEWQKFPATTFTLTYNGVNTGRISYTTNMAIDNTMNPSEDGKPTVINSTGSLIYIPKDFNQAWDMLVDKPGYTAREQAADLMGYIDGDKYLKTRKGKYAERFAGLQPWRNRFDLRVAVELVSKADKGGVELTFDMLNVGNFINPYWGLYQRLNGDMMSWDGYRLLAFAGKGEANAVSPRDASVSTRNHALYTVNASSPDDFKTKTSWIANAAIASTWSMQVGIRVKF